jgi:hypothetical protein
LQLDIETSDTSDTAEPDPTSLVKEDKDESTSSKSTEDEDVQSDTELISSIQNAPIPLTTLTPHISPLQLQAQLAKTHKPVQLPFLASSCHNAEITAQSMSDTQTQSTLGLTQTTTKGKGSSAPAANIPTHPITPPTNLNQLGVPTLVDV